MHIKLLFTTLLALGIFPLAARAQEHEVPLPQSEWPTPAQDPAYYPTNAPVPFFAASGLEPMAVPLVSLADYDAVRQPYGGLTRLERCGSDTILVRTYARHADPGGARARHIATVRSDTLLAELENRTRTAAMYHDTPWDHPWEGHLCPTRRCATDLECESAFCQSCIYFRCH